MTLSRLWLHSFLLVLIWLELTHQLFGYLTSFSVCNLLKFRSLMIKSFMCQILQHALTCYNLHATFLCHLAWMFIWYKRHFSINICFWGHPCRIIIVCCILRKVLLSGEGFLIMSRYILLQSHANTVITKCCKSCRVCIWLPWAAMDAFPSMTLRHYTAWLEVLYYLGELCNHINHFVAVWVASCSILGFQRALICHLQRCTLGNEKFEAKFVRSLGQGCYVQLM